MLTISPCTEPAAVAAYCKKLKCIPSPAYYLYRAENRGEVLSACLFEVGGDSVRPVLYEGPEDDVFLFDGVLRAGLNYAAEQGIPNGHLDEEFRLAHAGKFDRLNYPAQQAFDISNFFQKYKNCGSAL